MQELNVGTAVSVVERPTCSLKTTTKKCHAPGNYPKHPIGWSNGVNATPLATIPNTLLAAPMVYMPRPWQLSQTPYWLLQWCTCHAPGNYPKHPIGCSNGIHATPLATIPNTLLAAPMVYMPRPWQLFQTPYWLLQWCTFSLWAGWVFVCMRCTLSYSPYYCSWLSHR